MKQISLCLFFSILLFAPSLLEARDFRVNGIDPRSRLEMCLDPSKDQKRVFTQSLLWHFSTALTREECEEVVGKIESMESIVLRPGRVGDLSPLKELPKLKRLSLTELALKDITPLKTLTNLEKLSIRQNRVVSIEPLRGLTHLQVLILNDNNISDLSPLEGMDSLLRLYISGNRVRDVSVLGRLKNLSHLELKDNPGVDLSPLKGLRQGQLILKY